MDCVPVLPTVPLSLNKKAAENANEKTAVRSTKWGTWCVCVCVHRPKQ